LERGDERKARAWRNTGASQAREKAQHVDGVVERRLWLPMD